jgi:hypothetical protein
MGPQDLDRKDDSGMIHASKRMSTALERVLENVRAACPGWDCWPIQHHDGRVTWSARPEGALAAVITDEPSGVALIVAVHAYTKVLSSRLDEARRQLAIVPTTGIGRDKAAVLTELVASLERLAARA